MAPGCPLTATDDLVQPADGLWLPIDGHLWPEAAETATDGPRLPRDYCREPVAADRWRRRPMAAIR